MVGCCLAASVHLRAADLATDIQALLKDKALSHGEVSVEILKLGEPGRATTASPEILFRHNAETPLIPASNLKLVTTSAFLDRFGPDFRYRTLLVQRDHDLAIIGDADPSFGDAELLKKVGWQTTTVFGNWSDALKKRGLVTVHDVYVDDSICDQNFVNPDWPVNQQHLRYVAGVDGLNFNANALDFFLKRSAGTGSRVNYITDPPTHYATISNDCLSGNENAVWLSRQPGGNKIELRGQTNADNNSPISVTIFDPGLYAATVFSETLAQHGVHVEGSASRNLTIHRELPPEYQTFSMPTPQPTTQPTTQPSTDPAVSVLAIHETPIATVLGRANKDSMNLYAEAMCKRLGWASTHGTESGSWPNGIAAMGAFLQKVGVSAAEFTFDDGCGLSRKNSVSSNALARVLAYDFASANHDTFTASLSVAGVDGTLDNRFRDSDLRGRVLAKSGFISGVSCLSGLLKAKDNHWYAFSIMMNGVGDIATCKQLQEKIVKAVDADSVSR